MTVPPEETVGRTPPFPQVQAVQPMACPTCGLLPVLQYQTWGRFGRESIVEADEQFVADCKARNAAIREWNERVSAAPPSGEAPKLTAEQVRQADEIATGMIRHPIKPDYYRRMADALNALLGSAPQKEQG